MARQQTVYDNMEFEQVEFREYPKAVPVNDAGEVQTSPYNAKGKPYDVVIVNDEDEEAALTGPGMVVVKTEPASGRIEKAEDVREVLYRQAEEIGMKYDKRWTTERIEEALRQHRRKVAVSKEDVV